MRRIGILYHPKVPATLTMAQEIEDHLKNKDILTWVYSAWDKERVREQIDDTDLLITVGGDGTILRAVQAVIPGITPILGINLGNLGFMTELSADEILVNLQDILEGKGWIDERTMLQIELIASNQPPQVFHVLNDVVVARGEIARLIRIQASVDGQPLTTFRGDGVVVSTATGSSGYALAARGPVLYPQSQDLLLVPVAPHLSLDFPLILPATSMVTLRLETYLTATLSIDGHINLPMTNGDTITVKRSNFTARFLRIRPEGSFYVSLEDKLKG